MARDPDPERFAARFSGRERAVADYLLAEVLERQPGEVTRLLLRTSILERVSGPLADRLTGWVVTQFVDRRSACAGPGADGSEGPLVQGSPGFILRLPNRNA